ncbi:MAG: UDP-N-acetylmuramoyl-L-alanyl-D-glutamate--2,6-diaminopimelate ligase [Romboutsia sp.]|uniref:UDP-N-acetylmuramoyl-L-alanyl-D-glutamate--2, 6-diaminopimelate ligase n=1 Tax=Romboutsia sp. TaxID=1965302 RepID=UPI003F34B9A9
MRLLDVMNEVEFTFNKHWDEIKNIEIKDIAYNSSKCEDGYIFVAIKGETVDGHKYAKNAYKRGNRVFILQDDIELAEDAIKLFVEDSRIALSKMSSNYFGNPSKDLKVIGVTGTKGKTTITNYISSVLNKAGLNTGVIGTNGTFYNGIKEKTLNTTPESYELHRIFKTMLDNGVKCVSMEVSSGGIMMERVKDVDFDIAIFSNLSPDHIGPKEHPTFEHYLECKARLFKLAKHGIINIDDKYANQIIEKATCDIETFSIENNSDMKALNIEYSRAIDSLGVSFDVKTKNEEFNAYICAPGTFSIYNALAVISVCRYLNIEKDIMIEALKSAKVKGRVEVLPVLDYATIIVDYAHNGVSLESILQTLKKYDHNRLICLFGSVGGRTELRRKELGEVASRECDLCILTSDNPDFEDPMNVIKDIADAFKGSNCDYIVEPDRKVAVEKAIEIAREGDMIVFAGKGHEESQLIKGEWIPFSETEIAINAAKKLMENKSEKKLS